MRKKAPVRIVVQYPVTAQGKAALEACAADIHAAAVIRQIQDLGCTVEEKLRLLEEVIEATKTNNREQAR